MLQSSLESRFGLGQRTRFEILERKPARELVSSKDLLRRDDLGRTVVACPKGTVPTAWLKLTEDERASLVEPEPPALVGTQIPGPYGFSVTGYSSGRS